MAKMIQTVARRPLTYKEVSALTGMSHAKLRREVRAGRLLLRRLPGVRSYFTLTDVRDYMREHL